MTLIISAVWGPWSFHVSDRLVSIKDTQREHDPDSNKAIVVIGSRCQLVMGYSGLAYLNGRLTDQYIAECITGISDLSKDAAFQTWNPDPGLHYREVRNRIAEGLEAAYAKLPQIEKHVETSVLASGLQWTKQAKNVMFRVDIIGDSAQSSELLPKYFPFGSCNASAIGTCNRELLNSLAADLYHQAASVSSNEPNPFVFRDLMIRAVSDTAVRFPAVVGPHVVGVVLNPVEKKISLVFSPADEMGQPPTSQEIPANLATEPKIPTPWVLQPGFIIRPSVGNPGEWTNSATGLTFEYTAFGSDRPIPGGFYFGSQPRKGPPR
jgi:hypothetical protein